MELPFVIKRALDFAPIPVVSFVIGYFSIFLSQSLYGFLIGVMYFFLMVGLIFVKQSDDLWQNAIIRLNKIIALGFVALYALFIIFLPICCAPTNDFSNYRGTITEGLQSLQSRGGVGVATPEKANFLEGDLLIRAEVVVQLPISKDDVEFSCVGEICGNELTVQPDRINVEKRVEAYVVVCANEQREVAPRYCVSVSKNAISATDKCVAECGVP
ncbi:MAG: hypothetical protein V1835_05150 [Candidatus Micrarchaeota archaeon]